jgi:hypothetical protein
MRVEIAHLSDIHFKTSGNPLHQRIDELAAAIVSIDPAVDQYFVAFSGDVAQSGRTEEYEGAFDFVAGLRSAISKLRPHAEIGIIVVPGNHDVNHDLSHGVRAILLPSILEDETRINDRSIVEPILNPQMSFFEFAERVTGSAFPVTERIFFRRVFIVGDKSISFNCYNTAWASSLPETAAKHFPLAAFVETRVAYDLAIAVLHHPASWFEPNSAHRLRSHLEQTADVILTGHEHLELLFSKDSATGTKPQYSEGGVLQDWGNQSSAFSVILIDLDELQRREFQFKWTENLYKPVYASDWYPFERGHQFTRGAFQLTSAFSRQLNDIGTPFTHPWKATLLLEDLYVDPELTPLPTLGSTDDAISANQTDRLLSGGRILVGGADQSGKTTLVKVLFKRLHELQRVPVLLVGPAIETSTSGAVNEFILSAVRAQYEGDLSDEFAQLPSDRRALIIDDFDESVLNRRGRNEFLKQVCATFGTVILFASDVYWIEQLAMEPETESDLLNFAGWQLSEFSNHLRGRLIERWYGLGRETVVDEAHIARKIAGSQKLIQTLRGKNLFPSTPINILTVLQAEQSQRDLTVLGHGYIYEALISARLAAWPSEMPKDAVATLLASVAYDLFCKHKVTFSKDDLSDYVSLYFAQYRVRLPIDQLRRELLRCSLLEPFGDGYRFKYPYVYFYFVAKYMQRHMNDLQHMTNMRATIRDMTHALYVHENANILIFLVYLTQDRGVITDVIEYSRKLYSDYKACDMDKDVAFLNVVSDTRIQYQLPSSSPRENWHEEQRRLEESASDFESQSEDTDAATLNAAMKTLQVLGQVLRSFVGSLEASLKVEIARECYLLGLRSIMAMLSGVESQMPVLREAFVDWHLNSNADRSEAELLIEAERFIVVLCQMVVQTLIQRCAYAVGYEHLVDIYRDVLRTFEMPNIGVELIDHAIHLENFLSVDAEEVVRFYERIKRSVISGAVFRDLVYQYLKLFPTDHRTRQLLAEKLFFKVNDPRFLNPYKVN